MFGRQRRNIRPGFQIPIRMRSGTNPGGVGHAWVKDRFLVQKKSSRVFIPATLEDNPYLDREAYLLALEELDPVLFAQRRYGDWDAHYEGAVFSRDWFEVLTEKPSKSKVIARTRFWDFAATKKEVGKDPDWTVGTLMSRLDDDSFVVENVIRFQKDASEIEKIFVQTTKADGQAVASRWEEEGGSSGKIVTNHFKRLIVGYDGEGIKADKAKVVRWRPLAAQAKSGNVKILSAEWNSDWLDEMDVVPGANHDDQADSVSGAFNSLTVQQRIRPRISIV
jgi:predicted phage terminase large subunit-like protein